MIQNQNEQSDLSGAPYGKLEIRNVTVLGNIWTGLSLTWQCKSAIEEEQL